MHDSGKSVARETGSQSQPRQLKKGYLSIAVSETLIADLQYRDLPPYLRAHLGGYIEAALRLWLLIVLSEGSATSDLGQHYSWEMLTKLSHPRCSESPEQATDYTPRSQETD